MQAPSGLTSHVHDHSRSSSIRQVRSDLRRIHRERLSTDHQTLIAEDADHSSKDKHPAAYDFLLKKCNKQLREISVLQLECDRVKKENHQLKRSTIRTYTECSYLTIGGSQSTFQLDSMSACMNRALAKTLFYCSHARFRCAAVVHKCFEDLLKPIIRLGHF